MRKLTEPIWGQELIVFLNEYMRASELLERLIPILADIFIFVYPIFLVVIFLIGIMKRKVYYKKASLFIFFSGVFSIIVNIIIQNIFDKIRPNIVLGLLNEKTETVLHGFLPSSSFPSDHAALSMGIAMGTLVWGIKNKDKTLIWIGIILIVCSIVMSISRVVVGIHWPTDIVAGILVGILVVLILSRKGVYGILEKTLINPLVRFQEWIVRR